MIIWKNILVLKSKYSISSEGQIKNNSNNKILKQQISKGGGYSVITMRPEGRLGKAITFKIHRLVANEFISNEINKPEVNHIDGNKLNNNVSNLEWVTNKENSDHAIKFNLIKRGEEISSSILTEEDVKFIKKNYNIKYKSKDFQKMFGVSKSTISDIICGRKWKHVK